MKILIVEDDTLLLQGLILAAQTEGYACDGVSTARAAEQFSGERALQPGCARSRLARRRWLALSCSYPAEKTHSASSDSDCTRHAH